MAFRAATTSEVLNVAASSIDKPTGLTAGDEMLLVLGTNSATATVSSAPSGWTLLDALQPVDFRAWLYRKTATSGDVAATPLTSWTMSTSSLSQAAVVLAYSDVTFDTAVTDVSSAAATTYTPGNITPGASGSTVVTGWMIDKNTTANIVPDDTGLNVRTQTWLASFFMVTVADQVQATAAAITEGASQSVSSSQDWAAFHVAFAPSAPATLSPGQYGYGSYGGGNYGATFGGATAAATVTLNATQGAIATALKQARITRAISGGAAQTSEPALVQQITGQSGSASTALTLTLTSAPTAGNLLVFAMAGDKDTGALTMPSGWNVPVELTATSVSLYGAWKVSNGTETSVATSWSLSSSVGNMAWYAEYADPVIDGSTWELVATALNNSTDATANSWGTGTSDAKEEAGIGFAFAAIDSAQNVTSVGAWGNGYTARYSGTTGAGRGGIFVAEKLEAAGGTTSSTFNYTGTADQLSAALIVLRKVGSSGGGGVAAVATVVATPQTTPIASVTAQTGGTASLRRTVFASRTATAGSAASRILQTRPSRTATATSSPTVTRVQSRFTTLLASAANTASMIRQARTTRTGTQGASASVIRRPGPTRTATASSAATRLLSVFASRTAVEPVAPTVIRRMSMTRTAAASSTGTAVGLRARFAAVTAQASSAASFVRQVSARRTATATSTATAVRQAARTTTAGAPSLSTVAGVRVRLASLLAAAPSTATISRQARVSRTASQASAGTLGTLRNRFLSATASQPSAATVAKQAAVRRTATASSAGTVAGIRVRITAIAASASSSASVRRDVLVRRAATVGSSASVARKATLARALTAPAPAAAQVVRRISRTVGVSSSTSASLSAVRVRLTTLSASVASSASLARSAFVTRTAQSAAQASARKDVRVTETAQATAAPSLGVAPLKDVLVHAVASAAAHVVATLLRAVRGRRHRVPAGWASGPSQGAAERAGSGRVEQGPEQGRVESRGSGSVERAGLGR